MNEAQRLAEVQDSLTDMREDIRTKAPTSDKLDPARYLLQALKRRGLRVVSDDEWEENYEQGVEEGEGRKPPVTPEEARLDEALAPRW